MNIEKLIRDNIKKLKPYTSARDSFSEGILLDANENSIGNIVESNLELNRYPDPNQAALRKSLSKYLDIDYKNLFFGVGSDEIIDLLIRIFCEPRIDNSLILEPTYGMYKVACSINDVEVRSVLLKDDFQIDIEAVRKTVNDNTKIVFICSPNNPTGNLIDLQSIKTVCEAVNSIVVVDEAYIDFSSDGSAIKLIEKFDNLVVMRTFSKAWGLSGVRCGYCAANKEIITLLMKVKAPYTINKLTEEAILKALDNTSRKEEIAKKILAQKYYLEENLNKLDIVEKIFPSDANYLLVRFKNSKDVFEYLVKCGIIIRDRSNQPKLENCLRITVGTEEENMKLLKALGDYEK